MREIGVFRSSGLRAARLAGLSCSALDRPLSRDAELVVAVPGDEAITLGAFQRTSEVTEHAPLVRRGSGGAAARVGTGSVWVQLALARPDALVACDPERLLNRYVRPLLKALTKSGALAHYFGRDWISVSHRPAALVAFAHDATTGRCMVESIVAVSTPFALGDRASFMGKAPATLVEIAPRIAVEAVADAIVTAMLASFDCTSSPFELEAPHVDVAEAPPWTATREEALGLLAAGPDATGRMRVGGELMASRDAVASLEEAIARGEDLDQAVDASFASSGAVISGVRSLGSVRDLVVDATARTTRRR